MRRWCYSSRLRQECKRTSQMVNSEQPCELETLSAVQHLVEFIAEHRFINGYKICTQMTGVDICNSLCTSVDGPDQQDM